ncbi:hypothetical protein [Pyxidicoccus trucidator]|uniref:hypothetical protein n=1 Tax=Pyxidicoccus trucidator TaxID=2709662 RepID=UPI0013DA8810|nr:hypothetical protein [Pyxidicoccus trucidator]
MRKNAMAGLVMAAVLGPVGAASAATSYDFVIFHNNTSSVWRRVSQSIINGDGWMVLQPDENPAGGTKSGYYKTMSGRTTYYSATWEDMSDGTSCTFNSRSYVNAFGNMAFAYSVTTAGLRASTVICTGHVPPYSNLDGSYDFNYYASY